MIVCVVSVIGVSASLCNIADAAELTRNVHPNGKWGDKANEAVNEIASFMSVVNLDELPSSKVQRWKVDTIDARVAREEEVARAK